MHHLPTKEFVKFAMQRVAALFKFFLDCTFSRSLCHILTVCNAYKHFSIVAIYSPICFYYRHYTSDALRN